MKKKLKELFTLFGSENVRNISKCIAIANVHNQTFGMYKNYCKGEKDIVVCGAGPSLNQYKPIEGAIHIALNRAFLYPQVIFDFIFSQDYDGIRMVEEELVNYRPNECVKLLGTSYSCSTKCIPESLSIKANAKKFYIDNFLKGTPDDGGMVLDIENRPIRGFNNVGQSVMQFAFYMNPRKLYIVGCDMSGSHFTQKTQNEAERKVEDDLMNSRWSNKKRTEMTLDNWRKIKRFGEIYYPDTEVISINPVGLKGMFKDVYQN